MAGAYVYLKVLEYPPPAPWTYALFPCPLQRYWWLSFGWHHEVMNHIFDSTEESYTIRHLTDRVRSVNVERTFCLLNIWYIFILSVIHPFLIRQSPLVDHSLSATCPLNMRYSCVFELLTRSAKTLIPIETFITGWTPDKKKCCIFSVRSVSVTIIR